MRVLRLLPAAIAVFGLIHVGSAQYARPTFDDDDDFGYIPPATAVSQKPVLQPARPQVQPEIVDIKERTEQAPPRRITIRRRKKPTLPPQTRDDSTAPRQERQEVVLPPPPQSPLKPAVVSGLVPGANPLNQVPISSAPVTQPPGNFMFMRIGGYGFDNGEVPNGIEPPKQMLPELVPAGVRVRTPSGVVVSVRGQPGLYGIHPTPPPDANHGPRKPAPKPEIVYLTQTSPAPSGPIQNVPAAPKTGPSAPSVPYNQNIRTERPPARVRISPPQPVRSGDSLVTNPVRYAPAPQPPRGQQEQTPVGPLQPITRQTVRAPPRVNAEEIYLKRQPGDGAVQETPIFQIPNAGQFGQRLRPLNQESLLPAQLNEPAPPGVRSFAPPRNTPDTARSTGGRPRSPQGNTYVVREQPSLIAANGPAADNGLTRIVEPESVIQEYTPLQLTPVSQRIRPDVPREFVRVSPGTVPIDIKEPTSIRVPSYNPTRPITGFEQGLVGPGSNLGTLPLAPITRLQPLIGSSPRSQVPQEILVRRPPQDAPPGVQPQILEISPQLGTPAPQPPKIVSREPAEIPNVEIQRVAPGTPVFPQENVGPVRLPVRPPSSIPPNVNQRVPVGPGIDQRIPLNNVRIPLGVVGNGDQEPQPVAPVVLQKVEVQPRPGGNVTEPQNPNGFSFMRIGGFGFDNGPVPARFNVAPAKEMLPELVPAGVRVRTPSGVVVSVRGRPGLYGIHPTPAPDASFGPTKKPPRPEIVYLNQATPRPQPVATVRTAPPVQVAPIQYGTPAVVRRPARLPAPPINVGDQPVQVAVAPPQEVTRVRQEAPRPVAPLIEVARVPQGVPRPAGPLRVLTQVPEELSRPVIPLQVFTQVPQRAPESLVPLRVVSQVPQEASRPVAPLRVVTQVPQEVPRPVAPLRVLTQIPQELSRPVAPLHVFTQIPQEVSRPVAPLREIARVPQGLPESVTPLRVITQLPQEVSRPVAPLRVLTRVPQEVARPVVRVVTQVPQEVPRLVVPLRVVTQVPQELLRPVAPQQVFTQVPQGVSSPVAPPGAVTQVPQEASRPVGPPRVVTEVPQELSRPVEPVRGFTQVPQQVLRQETPLRRVTQVPQEVSQPVAPLRVFNQVSQKVPESIVPPRVITRVPQDVRRLVEPVRAIPQTVPQQIQIIETPIRPYAQPPQVVSQVPPRPSLPLQTPAPPARSPATQQSLPVRPRLEIQRLRTTSPPLPATKAPVVSAGSGGYGNDLSDFEDFEPPREQRLPLATASRETRVSSGVSSGEPKASAGAATRPENSDVVEFSSDGAQRPVNVVIGNIDEGPYNFHHRHTHENGFAFVKLGVPLYQKMEADVIAAAQPPVYARPAFQGDDGGVDLKKSRKKSS